jgi:hypothetical protein
MLQLRKGEVVVHPLGHHNGPMTRSDRVASLEEAKAQRTEPIPFGREGSASVGAEPTASECLRSGFKRFRVAVGCRAAFLVPRRYGPHPW